MGASDIAGGFVEARYGEARTYAQTAQTALSTFLTDMSTAMSTFTGVELDFSSLVFPAAYVPADFAETAPASPLSSNQNLTDLTTAVLQKLKTAVDNGKVLPAEAEYSMYNNAVARQDIANQKIEDDATNMWAARGYEVPSGVLSAIIAEAQAEGARNSAYINEAILAKSAELAMQSTGMIFTSYASSAKFIVDSYLGEVEAYKSKVAAYATKEQVGLGASETATRNIAVQVEAYIKEKQMELEEKLKSLQIQLEVMKSGAQVNAQVVASALSSVNASATYGYSASTQDYYDQTKDVVSSSISHSVSYVGGTPPTVTP